MPSFPHARMGSAVKHGGYPLPFVLYAPAQGTAEAQQLGRMLASNPWKCIELHLTKQKNTATEACSFLQQAQEFYEAGNTAGPIARPVLLYYAFLNLAKAIIRHKNPTVDLRRSGHGIRESQQNIRQRFTVTSQRVRISPTQADRVSILSEFVRMLRYPRLRANREWDICDLLVQIPAIHRAYSHTRGRAERLFSICDALFLHNHQTRRAWALLRVKRAEFTTGLMRTSLVARQYFRRTFTQVESDTDHQHCYSFQTREVPYGLSPLESLGEVCRTLREAGVVPILTHVGYRYYLSDFEPGVRIPPLLAAYMSVFYFGSVARYRPLDLEKMRKGKFAWAIEEMLATQGEQVIYLAASELLEREVARPWAVQTNLPRA